MTPFLNLIAEDLIKRFGNNLAKVKLIFPNRRAHLFFNDYLCQQAHAPVWAPQYKTIEELFEQAGTLRQADSIQLICELYQTYIEIYNKQSTTPSTETLDEFFFFGEILLSDFDDVDKNLVNARSLFSNLLDLDQLKDDFTHLREPQIEALMQYFKHAFHGQTPLKNAFWSIWNILGEVYHCFRKKLEQKGVAYPGMLMRSVIENENVSFDDEIYVFAGFNVLSKCEQKLFKKLKDKALFYWDFDPYYLHEEKGIISEAGRFIGENIRQFGSALDADLFDNFRISDKKITIIASASESGQSACISPWIDSLNHPKDFSAPDSAIVLCNENILPTVMHAIPPEKVENVNITMGFPITQSPVCSFLQVLTEMQTKGYSESGKAYRYKYILPVLRHPYTKIIFPEAAEIEKELIQGNIFFPTLEILKENAIFSYATTTAQLAEYLLAILSTIGKSYEKKSENSDIYTELYQESIFRAYQVVNRLSGLLSSGDLQIEKTTFLRLMKKLFSSTKIPFHGEPVKGLQVMGVLETRTLDFKNLILMSTNEGYMPGTNSDNSFIPQFLRKHFELSTIDHQDAIYAYYFYRLMQRAENITFIYSSDKTQTGKAEMSRFLLQLLTEHGSKIQRFSLQASIKPLQTDAIEIVKNEELIKKIKNLYDRNTNRESKTLSPSALNTFIDCSLKFYLQYIEGFRIKNELTDELDSSAFGTIFHRSAELLYKEIGRVKKEEKIFTPFVIKKEQLDSVAKNPNGIDRLIATAFSEEYFKGRIVNPKQYNGEQLINFRVIRHMLKRLIEFDRKQTPFTIYGLEYPVSANFDLNKNPVSITVGGIIDRLQEKDGILYIVDYKSSGTAKLWKTMDDLVTQKDRRPSHIFQTFTYASVLSRINKSQQVVVPSLLYLQEAGQDDYSPIILFEKEPIKDFNILKEDFELAFIEKVSELFDPTIPFRQTTVTATCSYCDFKNLCNR